MAAATATVLAVAWSVAAPGRTTQLARSRPCPATTKTSGLETSVPTTSDATSADPTPDVSPSTAQEYHPVVAPLVTVSSPGPTPAGGWVTTIPAGLELPFEGAKDHSVEASDWTELDGVDGWLLLPCDAAERTGYPSDAERTALRSIGYTAIEYAESEQLALYSSDRSAISAMEELRQAIHDCSAERTEQEPGYRDSYWNFRDSVGGTTVGTLAPDESFAAWNWNRTYDATGDPQYGLGGGFFVVTRVGNAIFLTVADGETDYAQPGQVRQSYFDDTKTTWHFITTMCSTFADADGC